LQIATGVAPPTVEAYEHLFFDVRSRPKHPLLIRNVAFDGRNCDVAFGGGLTEDDIDLTLKKAGFLHGGAVLEPMIRYFSSDWRILDEQHLPTRASLVALLEMQASTDRSLTTGPGAAPFFVQVGDRPIAADLVSAGLVTAREPDDHR
jgi:hypothetical protein